MIPPNPAGPPNPPPSRVDAIRLVAAVLPAVATAAPPARGFLTALGLLARMYTDPRYRASSLGRIGPIVFFAAAVGSYLFWNYLLPLPLIATLAERGILAGLAIGTYLILSWEIQRYRKVLDYLAKYG